MPPTSPSWDWDRASLDHHLDQWKRTPIYDGILETLADIAATPVHKLPGSLLGVSVSPFAARTRHWDGRGLRFVFLADAETRELTLVSIG